MSHVKNLQSFDKVIAICIGLGGNYNPGKQNLQVNAMTTLFNSALQINNEVDDAKSAFDLAVNNRAVGFKGLRTISSGVLSMLKLSDANPLTLDDARSSNQKIWRTRPYRSVAKATVEGAVPKPASHYGFDYATIASSFGALVRMVSTEPKYMPNEPELTVDWLKQKLAELESLNATVTQAQARLIDVRTRRNAMYYEGNTSMYETAQDVKTYMRSVFGYQSAQHHTMQQLKFTRQTA